MIDKIKHKSDFKLAHDYYCGDLEAGKKLYSDIYYDVRKFVFSKTKDSKLNTSQKEEIIHDAFMRSLKKLEKYSGNSTFKTYVIGIANHVIQEKYKEVSKEPVFYDDLEGFNIESVEDFYNKDPAIILIRKEKIEEINLILSKIKPEHSQILILRELNGVPFKQIASYMDKSEEATYSQYRRAIESFKRKIKEMYEKPTDFL